ncbi:hypothetical protein BDV96DRAFT_78329 [Lophiotrema nucula]|uniref:Rhodopsin domain-containing protein n=1 Tax=Lophiotrema nucula TaxID=690887 RepID=A0A6A5Z8L1_9PLEO|nr:hypothetical protein BDV96DRAFT_78329 [Lophiotrema nucula]
MPSTTPVLVGGVPVDTSQFDLTDHSSNVSSVRTTNIALIILVAVFVGLRFLVRLVIVRKVFVDDILILLASAFTIALASVCLAATGHGLGTHVWLLPLVSVFETVKSCIQYLFVCQVLYACAIAFTKISIISSYLRFIQERPFRICMYVTGVVIIGLWITGVFVTIFQCRPVSGAWDFTESDRKCINFVDYLYASSSITVATDLILCVLPWPYLWRIQMPVKQRIILCVLFGGGAGACVASIMRISKLETLRSMDVTYKCVPCLNLSVIECSLGIICVSIPPLRPLATRLFPNGFRTSRSSSSNSARRSHPLKRVVRSSENNSGTDTQVDDIDRGARWEKHNSTGPLRGSFEMDEL